MPQESLDAGRFAWVAPYATTCAAIAVLLAPHGEVVLHDIASDTIAGLWNPLSGRAVGDPALLAELPESWEAQPVQGPYRKVLADGRELSAVSALVTDATGQPVGLLCINFDRSPLTELAAAAAQLFAPLGTMPPELGARDWREEIAYTVDERCRTWGFDRRRLTRPQRLRLVGALEERDLFATRHAVDHAARALGVSRATTYTMLKETRDVRHAARVPA